MSLTDNELEKEPSSWDFTISGDQRWQVVLVTRLGSDQFQEVERQGRHETLTSHE
jgi:hypothetical protein